jgi:phosphatidate cytidylyltransferase
MKRVLTALLLIPIVVLLLFLGPPWLVTIACAVVACIALWEYLVIADATGASTPRWLTLGLTVALFAINFDSPSMMLPAFTGAGFILGVACTFRSPVDRVLRDASFAFFGLLLIVYPLSLIPRIRALDAGASQLLLLLVIVWTGDIAALYVGRSFGRTKLAPKISPGKTWEGAVASLLGSIISISIIVALFPSFFSRTFVVASRPHGALFGLLLVVAINIAAQLGDLLESAIKRGAGVKDSGTLLPGHGGVLDRIDAMLLALPVLWYALVIQQLFAPLSF